MLGFASEMLDCESGMLADHWIGLPLTGFAVQGMVQQLNLGPSASVNHGDFFGSLCHCSFVLEMVLGWTFASEMLAEVARVVGPPRILPENEWKGSSWLTTVSYLVHV